MAAAPADFRAAEVAAGKLERARTGLELRLEPTEDILAGLAAGADRAADRSSASPPSTGQTASSAPAQKLERKGVDLIVLNDVSDPAIGFESADNAVTLIDADGRDGGPASLQGRDRRGDPRPGRASCRADGSSPAHAS